MATVLVGARRVNYRLISVPRSNAAKYLKKLNEKQNMICKLITKIVSKLLK